MKMDPIWLSVSGNTRQKKRHYRCVFPVVSSEEESSVADDDAPRRTSIIADGTSFSIFFSGEAAIATDRNLNCLELHCR